MKHVTFLQAADGRKLTKQFTLDKNGELLRHPYPDVFGVTSHTEPVSSMEQLHAALVRHAELGHCLLKGNTEKELRAESRAGSTDLVALTDWIVIDNDGVPEIPPGELLRLLGLDNVDHIIHYSASAGISPGPHRYHLFLQLDRPHSPQSLKWLTKSWNLDLPSIRRNLSLNKSNNALRWPLDVTINQNDKLIYIAPPQLGDGVVDKFSGDRIQVVKGFKRCATMDMSVIDEERITQLERTQINVLRRAQNLPDKPFTTRKVHGQLVESKPDVATVTECREARGFTYVNLNGGDSWGYYHPTGKPEMLFNFKGEPNYLIKEFLPDYYEQACTRARVYSEEAETFADLQVVPECLRQLAEYIRNCQAEKTTAHFGFRDGDTDQYYIGSHDFRSNKNDFNPTSSITKIRHYVLENGQPPPKIVPTWRYAFAPDVPVLIDIDSQFINRFEPSIYVRESKHVHSAQIPPAILRVIKHALGDDEVVLRHFINWLAVLLQFRIRTQTAWILQGTTGTGKGLLFNNILRPLIGAAYCQPVTISALEENFNRFADQCLLLFVDETDTDQVKEMSKVIAKLKNWATEETIAIRGMRSDLRQAKNYLNIIMASNQPNSMRVERNDRRFTVCPRQENKLILPGENSGALVAQIEEQLQDFCNFILSYPADRDLARTALENDAKRILQDITETSGEEVAAALREGNLAYFVQHLPEDTVLAPMDAHFNGHALVLSELFQQLIHEAISKRSKDERHFLDHKQLFILFEFLSGNTPRTPAKLTKYLGHHSIVVEPHRVQKKTRRGYMVEWKCPDTDLAEYRPLSRHAPEISTAYLKAA